MLNYQVLKVFKFFHGLNIQSKCHRRVQKISDLYVPSLGQMQSVCWLMAICSVSSGDADLQIDKSHLQYEQLVIMSSHKINKFYIILNDPCCQEFQVIIAATCTDSLS